LKLEIAILQLEGYLAPVSAIEAVIGSIFDCARIARNLALEREISGSKSLLSEPTDAKLEARVPGRLEVLDGGEFRATLISLIFLSSQLLTAHDAGTHPHHHPAAPQHLAAAAT
jgi:hypothetical protein